jgi:hypothetical protein
VQQAEQEAIGQEQRHVPGRQPRENLASNGAGLLDGGPPYLFGSFQSAKQRLPRE